MAIAACIVYLASLIGGDNMINKCPSLAILAKELHGESGERLQELADTVYESALDIYRTDNISDTEDICTKALNLLNQVQEAAKGKAFLNRLLANVYHKQGKLKESLELNHTAAEQLLAAGEIKAATSVYGNCGALLFYLGDRAGSYRKQLMVLSISEENDLKYEKARALINISVILEGRREFSEALNKLEQAGIIFRELSDERGLAYSFAAIADIKKETGDIEESLIYHRKAMTIRKEMGNEREILLSFINFPSALIKAKKPEEAEKLCREALEITDSSHWPTMKALVLINLIEALLDQGLAEQAAQKIRETRKLFSTFAGHDDNRVELKFLEARAFHAMGKNDKAYLVLCEYVEGMEQIRSESREEEISRLKIAAEVETSLREKETIAQKNLELSKTNDQLREALAKVKTLSGMLPICGSCKRIRNDEGYWQQLESYISRHSNAEFTHGLCSDCMKKLYPELPDDLLNKAKETPDEKHN
ncbi:MAG: hypothetical protein K8S62_08305 [Candidatus Sabulitectum sp.]|nr:hypothetical protein [Candidatus Sabulitectum sp.]